LILGYKYSTTKKWAFSPTSDTFSPSSKEIKKDLILILMPNLAKTVIIALEGKDKAILHRTNLILFFLLK
jgi:hypothetical protein